MPIFIIMNRSFSSGCNNPTTKGYTQLPGQKGSVQNVLYKELPRVDLIHTMGEVCLLYTGYRV